MVKQTINTQNPKMNRKNTVAWPLEYPPVAPKGYYALAFRKTGIEKEEVRQIQLEHKRAIAEKYPMYSARLRKRILNP